MKTKNSLLGYKNRSIYQDDKMFNFTLDSVLVSRFFKPTKNTKLVADLGTNNAVIPLIISKYTKAKIYGVEIQKAACELAKENVELNNLQDQIEIVNSDMRDFAKAHANTFDAVICNPPFFKVGEKTKTKEVSKEVADARHETLITLEEIIEYGSKLINNSGTFTIVHRAERAIEIIDLFKQNHLTVKRIQFVYSKKEYDAKTVLIEGIKQGKDGVTVLPALIAHNEDETYTDELLEYFRD